MNIEVKVARALRTNAWIDTNEIQKKQRYHQKLKVLTQHVFHRTCLIRFFCYNNDFGNVMISQQISFEHLINIFTQTEPTRLISKLSPNISQYITQWIYDFVTKPKEFAKSAINTLPHYPQHIDFFIYVTFPSIFHHFQLNEYISLAVTFLKEIIDKAPSKIAISFVSSFLLNANRFIHLLWILFDEIIISRNGIKNQSEYFIVFLEALKKTSSSFTKQHVEVIQYYHQNKPQDFAKSLITNFLNITYDESHLSNIYDESRCLIKFLNYASKNPLGPHFTRIYEALIPKDGTLWVQKCTDLFEKRTPIVMSCHEFYMIQQLAKENPSIVRLKYIDYLSVPKSTSFVLDPVFIEEPYSTSDCDDYLFEPLIFTEKHDEDEQIEIGQISPQNSQSDQISTKNDILSNKEDSILIRKDLSDDSMNNHLLLRQWRQISQYARSNSIHPLELFTPNNASFPKLNNTVSSPNLIHDSDLYHFAVEKVYSESIEIQKQFENFMKQLLHSRFLEDTIKLSQPILANVLQKFMLKLITNDNYTFQYTMNNLNIRSNRNYDQSTIYDGSYSLLRYSSYFTLDNNTDILDKNNRKERFGHFLRDQSNYSINFDKINDTSVKITVQETNTPTLFVRKRRHSNHELFHAHRNIEINHLISAVLKLKGRATSLLQMSMITKIIDERQVFKRKNDTFEAGDNTLNNLQKQFHSIITIWQINQKQKKGDEPIYIHDVMKYIKMVSKHINQINYFKQGTSILFMILIGIMINQITEKIISNNIELAENKSKLQSLVFETCLLYSHPEGLFGAFVLYHMFCHENAGFSSAIPMESSKSILIISNSFWMLLKKLNDDFYSKCVECLYN